MVVAQKVKEAEITEQDSLLLTRNLLRIAIFNISYIRGLFPEKYFNDKSVPALEMKIKKLIPMDAESRRLIDWMEKGVYDALQKKYLKTLLFCVCEAIDGPMIEEYAFSFSYSDSDSREVSMNVNRNGTKKGGIFKCDSNTVITPNQMRSSACKMIRTLVQLMRTLDSIPAERTILMKLLYYDDVTPADYEPPFFRGCTDKGGQNPWTKSPLKMEVGNVNSKHLVLSLKVKSVLDPCEDENNEMGEDGISIGADSGQSDESSESDSEMNASQEDRYIVAPAAKGRPEEENDVVDEDDTQDPEEDEQQLSRVRDWVSGRLLDAIELTDVLSHFPDISIVLTEGTSSYNPAESSWKSNFMFSDSHCTLYFLDHLQRDTEIMDKLVREGVLFKTGTDNFTKNRKKVFDYDFAAVKEEDCRPLTLVEKSHQIDDPLYVKALNHALQMKYVSAAKLQSKLDGEVNQAAARKIIDRMTRDGYLEAKGNGRLGKRVIQSAQTEKKLMEVRRALDNEDADMVEAQHQGNNSQPRSRGNINSKDNSTCGILHSIGSDLTRMRISSETNQESSFRSEQTISKTKDQGSTPLSRPQQPVASRESFARGSGGGKANGNTNRCAEADTGVCKSSQEKRFRKTSMVKEPILQYSKRQKSQAA